MLFRTTLTGDVPVGPDGFRSQIVEGAPFGVAEPEALKKFKVQQDGAPAKKAERSEQPALAEAQS